MSFFTFLQSLRGPHLYRIRRTIGGSGINYTPNRVENLGNYTLLAVRCLWFLCKLSSPLWIFGLIRKGAFSPDSFNYRDLEWITRPFIFVMTVTGAAYLARGIGRCFNEEYVQFISDYHRHRTSEDGERLVGMYDCDFAIMPVEYRAETPLRKPAISPVPTKRLGIVWKAMALLVLKTIGRRLLYPGSLQLIKSAMGSTLVDGRSQLMENRVLRSKRGKIATMDGNFIDTMFVDKRSQTPQGNILVICCEGNAGFYEVGIMNTPLQAGYSVLGWNHPGFGCSTGEPLPTSELNAADAVMQYATKHLHFAESDILVFAWSIGGFPAAWLAATYPHIRGVVLDATFDDLLPLALARMPPLLSSVVTLVVRHYLNLNIADLLCQYHGPILLIRRTLDEIIAIEDNELKAVINRGDYLLKRLLMHRYPSVVNSESLPLLDQWLRSSPHDKALLEVRYLGDPHDARLIEIFKTFAVQFPSPHDIAFPLTAIGADCDHATRLHLTLYLAHLHMKDVEATHCTPLPLELFKHPWHLVQFPNISS